MKEIRIHLVRHDPDTFKLWHERATLTLKLEDGRRLDGFLDGDSFIASGQLTAAQQCRTGCAESARYMRGPCRNRLQRRRESCDGALAAERPRVTHVLPGEGEAHDRLTSMNELFREFGAGDPT